MNEGIINTNDYVEVILTEHGRMLYNEVYGSNEQLSDDLEEPLKIQMWEFMNIFGEHLYNGASQIIVDNEMKVKLE